MSSLIACRSLWRTPVTLIPHRHPWTRKKPLRLSSTTGKSTQRLPLTTVDPSREPMKLPVEEPHGISLTATLPHPDEHDASINQESAVLAVDVDATQQQTRLENTLHAKQVTRIDATTTPADLRWIDPPTGSPLRPLRTHEAIKQQQYDRELAAFRALPPPPPGGGFNSLDPLQARAERAYMDAVEKNLPPGDLFRVPIMLSRPWFDYVLWSWCGFVGVCVVLFGNWDLLSEGHPHVFSGIQGAYRDLRDSWTTLDAGEEERLIAERLELAVKAARAVANGKGGE